MHWCSLKSDYSIKVSIPKLYENTPFHNLIVTHAATKNHQVTRTLMENQENTLTNTKKMKVDEHALVLTKNRLNSPYQNCMKKLLFIVLMLLMLAQK